MFFLQNSFLFLFISINFVNTYPDRVPQEACNDMMPRNHNSTLSETSKSPYYINPMKINKTSTANESFRSKTNNI